MVRAPPRAGRYSSPENEDPQHIHALWSIALHLILLAAMYYFFSHRPAISETVRRIDATRSAAIRYESQQRLDDLSNIEEMLADSVGERPTPQTATNADASPQELLAEARARYEAIRTVERYARAKELARLLEIPVAQALLRVPDEMPALPPVTGPVSQEKAAEQMAQLEARAREALSRRRDQLQQRNAIRGQLGGASTGTGGSGKGADSGDSQNGVPADTLQAFEALASEFEVSNDPARNTGFDPKLSQSRSVPPVDPGPMRKAEGRMIGRGGMLANRIYVDTWYIVGPFEPDGEHPLETKYPPESGVDLDGVYLGKNGKAVSWRHFQAGSYPMYLPVPSENAIYYGYTEVMLDRDRELWAWIGADDDSKLWLNDRLVWAGGESTKPWFYRDARGMTEEIAQWNLSENKVKVRFRQGRNRVLFKLGNGIDVMFFSMVLTSTDTAATPAPAASTVSP